VYCGCVECVESVGYADCIECVEIVECVECVQCVLCAIECEIVESSSYFVGEHNVKQVLVKEGGKSAECEEEGRPPER